MAEGQDYSGQPPMNTMVFLMQNNFQMIHATLMDLTTQLGKLDDKVTAQLSKMDDKLEAVSERVRALEIANAARAAPTTPPVLPPLAPGAGMAVPGVSGALRSAVPPPPARPSGINTPYALGLPSTPYTAGSATV